MDVDTLLTRQMELHTTTRRPPKNAEQLAQLRDTLHEYNQFFKKLQALTEDLNSDRVTVFQCLMHISVGGVVKFDKQAQNGEVPMHQAKVLARSTAIELEPLIRERVPNQELMVYVGLSKDLRTTLRVKVEDENDLKTAQKSVEDSVEYLDFIYTHASGDASKMFDFYMVEDGPSLLQMIEDAEGPTTVSQQSSMSLSTSQRTPTSMLVQEWNPKAPVPTPESFLTELDEQLKVALDKKTHASERGVVMQHVLDWVSQLADEPFKKLFLPICEALQKPLSTLCCDKRSILCRVSCETIITVSQRVSALDCVSLFSDKDDNEKYGNILSSWTSSLLCGIYVTISAISTATDSAIRQLVLLNHGHMSIVQQLLHALETKKQTELRRKCLGYLALCVAASEAHTVGSGSEYIALLAPVAKNYVDLGDSPSRKMARALCAVLRGITMCETLIIDNPKVEQLVCKEFEQLRPFFSSPRSLESKLFENGDFVASISSTGSSDALDATGRSFRSSNLSLCSPHQRFHRKSLGTLAGRGAEKLKAERHTPGGSQDRPLQVARHNSIPMSDADVFLPLSNDNGSDASTLRNTPAPQSQSCAGPSSGQRQMSSTAGLTAGDGDGEASCLSLVTPSGEVSSTNGKLLDPPVLRKATAPVISQPVRTSFSLRMANNDDELMAPAYCGSGATSPSSSTPLNTSRRLRLKSHHHSSSHIIRLVGDEKDLQPLIGEMEEQGKTMERVSESSPQRLCSARGGRIGRVGPCDEMPSPSREGEDQKREDRIAVSVLPHDCVETIVT